MSITSANLSQHQASNPAEHIWVSASAGSGKTTVLVSRLLRLLIGDGLPAPVVPHRILCLTYTKAAATEMQLRLDKELIAWATMPDTDLYAALETLTMRQPDEAMRLRARALFAELSDSPQPLRIQTIHSFCQSILARFPLEAGIAPGFTALDEIEARGILQQALERAWQQPGGMAWRRCKSWLEMRYNSAGQLQGLIPNLLRNWPDMANIIPDEASEETYYQKTFTALDAPDDEEKFWQNLFSDHALPTDALRTWAAKSKNGTAIDDFITASPAERTGQKEFYWDLFFTKENEPRKRLPDDLLGEPQRLLKIKDQRLAAASAAMGILLARVSREYQRTKDHLSMLDFADMIRLVRDLLAAPDMGTWVHYKLDGGIDHILLDEAQDTAPDQWEVIHALAAEFFTGAGTSDRPRSLFVVGDPKQSIYSFQGANASLFHAFEIELAARAEAAQTALTPVPLAYSFRTAPNLLAWVDQSFAGQHQTIALHGHPGTIKHHAIHENRIGAARIYPPVTAVRSEKSDNLLLGIDDTDTVHNVRLAAQIAETISDWLKSGRQIAGENRPIQPRDIMILLQQRTTLADALQSALAAAGVPVMGSDRLKLMEAPAVQDIFALCKFLLFPQDNLNLAIVLRTPFINLPEIALEKISIARGEQSLWQALNIAAETKTISDYLKDLLAHTDNETGYETLARILFAPCPAGGSGFQALRAHFGAAADDPVHELMRLMQQEGKAHRPLSLGGFMDWLQSADIQIKREMAQQNQNLVRILTVHGAKGLEAPIVILADASDAPHTHGSKQDKAIKFDGEIPHFLFAPGKAEEGPAFDRADSVRAKSDEHQRLLYVALTRASHEIHVFGKCSAKGEVRADSWYPKLQNALENLGAHEENGILYYGAADEFGVRATTQSQTHIAYAPPAPVASPTARQPIAITEYIRETIPAGPATANANPLARQRGTTIHRLLELLPDMAAEFHAERAGQFLARELPELTLAEQRDITRQVLDILQNPELTKFFGPHARAEVPIMGEWQGVPVFGKIDRLYITETDIGILDFKTGEPPQNNAVPSAYALQVQIYADLLAKIYPNRPIHTGILWTQGGKLLWLPRDARVAA